MQTGIEIMGRRRFVRTRELTAAEDQRIVYWLKHSELSMWKIAQNFCVTQEVVKAIRDREGLQDRAVNGLCR